MKKTGRIKEAQPTKIEISLYRGMYRLLTLTILEKTRMKGYQIFKNIKNITGIKPSLSTIHDILSEMEKRRLIESIKTETNEKYYIITKIGKKKLEEIKERTKNKINKIINLIFEPSPDRI